MDTVKTLLQDFLDLAQNLIRDDDPERIKVLFNHAVARIHEAAGYIEENPTHGLSLIADAADSLDRLRDRATALESHFSHVGTVAERTRLTLSLIKLLKS